MISIWLILFLHLFSSLEPYQATKFQGLAPQEASWDCGPAAAAAVLSLAGESVQPWPGDSSRQNASLVELSHYLQSHSWEVEAYFLCWDDLQYFLRNSPGRPLITHSNRNGGHYLVLLGLTDGWLVVTDPAEGVRAVAPRLFLQEFSGYVLYFPGLPALPAVDELVQRTKQRLDLLRRPVY